MWNKHLFWSSCTRYKNKNLHFGRTQYPVPLWGNSGFYRTDSKWLCSRLETWSKLLFRLAHSSHGEFFSRNCVHGIAFLMESWFQLEEYVTPTKLSGITQTYDSYIHLCTLVQYYMYTVLVMYVKYMYTCSSVKVTRISNTVNVKSFTLLLLLTMKDCHYPVCLLLLLAGVVKEYW